MIWQACPDDTIQCWTFADGSFTAPIPPAPTVNDFTSAISSMLDGEAHAKSYDGALSISTYVGSTNAQWAAEASTVTAWRDSVWADAYPELVKVTAGERSQPVVSDFLKELPPLKSPFP
ncbi:MULTISPECIES: hypothetical protein [unclassified Rhizobium]